MLTQLPAAITTVEEAKAFLTQLHKNGESYHPEDSAHQIMWKSTGHSRYTKPAPSFEDCDQLDKLMLDIYNLPGNEDPQNYLFDPCEYLLELCNIPSAKK